MTELQEVQSHTKNIRVSHNSGNIFCQILNPAKAVKRSIVILHDYFDYHKRYRELANYLVDHCEAEVCLIDLPGFGMSEGDRGNITSFRPIERGLQKVISESLKERSELILIGIGLGGLICADLILNHKESLKFKTHKQILINPFFKLNTSFLETLESFLGEKLHLDALLPHYDPFHNCSDFNSAQELKADPLAIKVLKPISFQVIRNKMKEIKKNLYFIEDKTLFIVSKKGSIIDNGVVELFKKAMPEKAATIKEYRKSRHDILHDVEKDIVFKDIAAWLKD